MSVSIATQWMAAQVAERRFHCDHVPEWYTHADPNVRRAREYQMRLWYAGMLRIPATVDATASVTDIACGPQGLLLTFPTLGRMVAVDPLRFTNADEEAYAFHRIARVILPAEQYDGEPTDEVWLYNGLQHVMDWEQVLRVACRTATQRVRLFEWVNVQTDALHLHTLTEPELRRVLHDAQFHEVAMVRGETALELSRPTQFYAGIWER